MNYVAFLIYIVLTLLNALYIYNTKRNWLIIISSILCMLLLTYFGDFRFTYDINNYLSMYERPFLSADDDFHLYYLFYLFVIAGQDLGLDFQLWWLLMNTLSFVVLFLAIRVHKLDPHLFLFFFMAYYFLNFYSGFKFYYGFCLYFWAFGYLFKPGKSNTLKYIILCALAGGFHMMYYFYIPFVLLKVFDGLLLKRRWIIGLMVTLSLLLSVYFRITGTASSIFSSFDTGDSDKIQEYLEMSTNFGFYIPVCFHILCVLLASHLSKRAHRYNDLYTTQYSVKLWQNTISQVLFYPAYMLALTFTRLTTVSSLILISYQGDGRLVYSSKDRKQFMLISLLILFAFYFRQFVIGNLWDVNIIPLFTIR